jgi:hypothetical protein
MWQQGAVDVGRSKLQQGGAAAAAQRSVAASLQAGAPQAQAAQRRA